MSDAGKSNVDRLLEAGAINKIEDVKPEHRDILNGFTPEEIDGIIKLKQRIIEQPLASDSSTGGAIL